MILSSHIIAASAVAAPLLAKPFNFANAALVFIVSFLSHYALDMIPHWDYKMASIGDKNISFAGNNEEKEFIKNSKFILIDFFKNTADGLIGLLGAFLILGFSFNFKHLFFIFIIAFASILPDFLEFLYLFSKKFPLDIIHKFHNFVHGKRMFLNKPFFGIVSQILTLLAIIVLFAAIYAG